MIERSPSGGVVLRLGRAERDLLRTLPAQLRELLGTDDPVLRRLAPPAYPDDPEHEAEYRELVAEDLGRQRLRALELMEATVDAERLNEEEATAWLGALNDLRLVLGTRLDVTEDLSEVPETDPRAPALAVYHYLGWLQEQLVAAAAGELD